MTEFFNDTSEDLLEILKAECHPSNALQRPKRAPSQIPLQDIHCVPGVFQVRAEGTDEKRAKEISQHLNGTKSDERIHVWWSGQRWIVLDGHHRHRAYQIKAEREKHTPKVPVEAHMKECLAEAICLAAKLNDREKVRISQEDISTACWRSVGAGNLSIRQTAKMMNVSKATVSRMRKTRKELLKAGFPECEINAWTWKEAQRMNRPLMDFPEPTDAEKAKTKGAEWARLFNKASGFQATHFPEAMVWAIAYMTDNGCLMQKMMNTDCFEDAFHETLEACGYRYHEEIDQEVDVEEK